MRSGQFGDCPVDARLEVTADAAHALAIGPDGFRPFARQAQSLLPVVTPGRQAFGAGLEGLCAAGVGILGAADQRQGLQGRGATRLERGLSDEQRMRGVAFTGGMTFKPGRGGGKMGVEVGERLPDLDPGLVEDAGPLTRTLDPDSSQAASISAIRAASGAGQLPCQR